MYVSISAEETNAKIKAKVNIVVFHKDFYFMLNYITLMRQSKPKQTIWFFQFQWWSLLYIFYFINLFYIFLKPVPYI